MFAAESEFNIKKEEVLEALGQLKVRADEKVSAEADEEKPLEKVMYRRSNFEPWSVSDITISDSVSLPDASINIPFHQIRCLWHNCQFKFWRRGSSRSFLIQTFDQAVYYFKTSTVRESGLLRARIVRKLQKSCCDRLLSVSSYPMPTLTVLRVKIKCKYCSEWSVSYGGYCENHRREIENTETNPQCNWVLDDASPACQVCGALFTMIRRRHHCRKCGILICHRCSVYFDSGRKKRTRRLCRECGSNAATDDISKHVCNRDQKSSDDNVVEKTKKVPSSNTKKSIIVRLPVPENARPGQIMEVSHVGRRYHVRVPQDAATRGTGTFPAQFPKHPLLRSKNVVLLGNDKPKDKRNKKRYSRSMDSTDPETSVSRSYDRSVSLSCQASYELESKEWWAKEDRIAREKRFLNYFSRLMTRGLRVIKHGRDGRRQYRCLWILSNKRVCVTNNSPSYYKKHNNGRSIRRCKGVNVDDVVRIQYGASTSVFAKTFGRDGVTKEQSKRCFSILLLDDAKTDRRKITSTLKKLLAGSQISRSSLDIEVVHVDTKTGKLSQRRSELLCRWLIRMLSCHIGLCSSPDMNGQFTETEMNVLEETICPMIELSAPKSIRAVVNKRLSSMTSPSRQRFSASAPDILQYLK